MDWSKYKEHFKPTEFNCKCGCFLNNMTESHMDMLHEARKIARIPFVVRSGSRCKDHNWLVGGQPTSDHLVGEGSDIQAKSGRAKWIILNALLDAGFNRIGIGKDFIHAGSNSRNPGRVVWVY